MTAFNQLIAFYLVEETSAKHYQPKVTETTTTEYFSLDEEPPRFFNGQHEQMWQILKDFTHIEKIFNNCSLIY